MDELPKKELSPRFLSEFCSELSLLIRAGITVNDGLSAMAEDYDDPIGFLSGVAGASERGENLYEALSSSGRVPSYMLDTVRLGERSGKLDACLLSLAEYYDRRANLTTAIRSALLYPFVLILMLAAVMAILALKVLPIFAEVFEQMGVTMGAFSAGLVTFGRWTARIAAIVIGILALLMIISLIIYAIPAARRTVLKAFRSRWGGRGLLGEALTAQFASAMSTAISSGLGAEEAVELASEVVSGVKAVDEGLDRCKKILKDGESLEKGLSESGVFAARDSRLLSLGVRTGTADTVMAEIARRSEARSLEHIDNYLSRIEPTLVIIISVVVGAVLLSVMLPLTGIMSSLG